MSPSLLSQTNILISSFWQNVCELVSVFINSSSKNESWHFNARICTHTSSPNILGFESNEFIFAVMQ